MNKYLIFRTDRIGDFLVSLILINSIKRQDINSHITVVASKSNYEFIKSFKVIDDVILFKNNIFDKLNLLFLLKKNNFNYVIAHDGKKRSKFISFFLNSKYKYISKNHNFSSYIEEIKFILKKFKFNFIENDLDTLSNRDYSSFIVPETPYLLIHFDEKWFFDLYIKNYINIEPTLDQLHKFLISLCKKTNKKIVVTTGINTPALINKFFNENTNNKIKILKNLNFQNLEAVIIKSSLIISCHGAVSHIAAAKKIEQIDIIDKSYNYSKWTKHFRNYKSLERKKFNILTDDIINLL